MNEDDRAVEWSARRRRRNFLVSGVIGAVSALVAIVAMLAGGALGGGLLRKFRGALSGHVVHVAR